MTKARARKIPDWEMLLAHAEALQTAIPGAVLVGGTAAALHAGHRVSMDHDHVIAKLGDHYDSALRALEAMVGWQTHRRVRSKMILGSIDGIDAGLRNQRRSARLDVTMMELKSGRKVRVPTVAEMLRIKAFLVVERNATRDYLDVAALASCLEPGIAAPALTPMNELYAEFVGENGDMLTSLIVRLTHPDPYDLTEVDLSEYKGIVAPWNSWQAVEDACRELASQLLQT